jgi:hypothetical protein
MEHFHTLAKQLIFTKTGDTVPEAYRKVSTPHMQHAIRSAPLLRFVSNARAAPY